MTLNNKTNRASRTSLGGSLPRADLKNPSLQQVPRYATGGEIVANPREDFITMLERQGRFVDESTTDGKSLFDSMTDEEVALWSRTPCDGEL